MFPKDAFANKKTISEQFLYPFLVTNKFALLILDVGAVPQKGSGLHRYVFLLFEQVSGKKDYKESIITNRDATRTKFSVREFVARHHLNQPIAINFFQAKFDESVPALLGNFLNLQDDK